jgi:hypothetical protein
MVSWGKKKIKKVGLATEVGFGVAENATAESRCVAENATGEWMGVAAGVNGEKRF